MLFNEVIGAVGMPYDSSTNIATTLSKRDKCNQADYMITSLRGG